MDSFSKVLKRGGFGHKFKFDADVTMQNEKKFNLTFEVYAINEKKAKEEAMKVLDESDYIVTVHKISNPNKIEY